MFRCSNVLESLALIEVRLRLQRYKQLQQGCVLAVLKAVLRVPLRYHARTFPFHVCHRRQPEKRVLASMFWKCVWRHEILISLPGRFCDTCKQFREEIHAGNDSAHTAFDGRRRRRGVLG